MIFFKQNLFFTLFYKEFSYKYDTSSKGELLLILIGLPCMAHQMNLVAGEVFKEPDVYHKLLELLVIFAHQIILPVVKQSLYFCFHR